MAAVFYTKLPPEVYYHFTGDIPDREVSRTAIIAWLLILQFVLMVIGVAISGIGSIVSRKYKISNINNTKRLLMAMGNMVALPQIILIFAMLDIFLYNAYYIRLIPLWIIIVIVLLIGTIVLVIFFYRIIRQLHTSNVKQNQE